MPEKQIEWKFQKLNIKEILKQKNLILVQTNNNLYTKGKVSFNTQ